MRTERSKNWFVMLAAALVALTAAACNTVAGAGRDLSTAGEAVTETAKDVEEDIQEEN